MSDASLGTATLRTQLDTSGLKTGLDTARTQTERTFNDMDKRVTAFGSKLQSFGTKWSLAITTPLTAIGVVGVRSAMQLETFAASLNVLIGDAQRANAVFEELYEFSANVPFDWRTLTDATRTLAGFGVEAEDVVSTLSLLGDIASGTQSDLVGLTEIYGRVLVTGRLSMQEVNSLALRGVPIYQELSKVLGVSTDRVRDLISSGTVGFPQLQQVITNLTSEGGKFFGMMDAQANTVEGRLNRLKDSFEQVTDVVGERLLPMFDRLISAGQSATDWFVNLDESAQGVIVTIGGLAAAIGPLTVGLGTIIKLLPVLKVGLAALTGPAGLIVLGITAVAGLAVAMSGSGNPDSLTNAINRLDRTISGADAIENFESVFASLADALSGKVRRAFEGAKDDIWSIVNAAEDAQEALMRIQLGAQLSQELSGNRAMQALLPVDTRGREFGAQYQINQALVRGEFGKAIELLQGYVDMAQELERSATRASSSGGRGGASSTVAPLVAFLEDVIAGEKQITDLLAGRNTGSGSGGGSGGSGVTGIKRTIEDILKELDEAGTHAMRVAAFEGTKEAALDAARTRAKLISGAISELLEDPHYGLLPDWLLDSLRARLEAAYAEIEELSSGLPGARPRSPAATRAMERAEVEGPGLGMQTGMTAEALKEALVEARGRLGPVATEWADYLAKELEREVARMQAGHGMGQVGRYLNPAPYAQVGGGSLTALRPPQVRAQLADPHTMSGSLFSQFSDYLDEETQRQAERMRNMDLTTTNTDRAIIAERQLIMAREAAAAANNQLLADFARSEAERTAAMRYGGENATTYTEQLQLQAAAMKLAAEQGITLTEALEKLSRVRIDSDELGKQLTMSTYRRMAGERTAFMGADGGIRRRPVDDSQSHSDWVSEQKDAADQFSRTVVQAGFAFGDATIKALQDGDIPGLIRAGLSGAGSIFGAAKLPDISFLGGSIGIGSLIAGGLGLISSLIGGLFGGRRDAPENNRARGVTPRGAPAIDLTVMINQSLNIQSLTDPASRRAVDGLLDDMVRRLEDTLKRNVIPRLNALEGATA